MLLVSIIGPALMKKDLRALILYSVDFGSRDLGKRWRPSGSFPLSGRGASCFSIFVSLSNHFPHAPANFFFARFVVPFKVFTL